MLAARHSDTARAPHTLIMSHSPPRLTCSTCVLPWRSSLHLWQHEGHNPVNQCPYRRDLPKQRRPRHCLFQHMLQRCGWPPQARMLPELPAACVCAAQCKPRTNLVHKVWLSLTPWRCCLPHSQLFRKRLLRRELRHLLLDVRLAGSASRALTRASHPRARASHPRARWLVFTGVVCGLSSNLAPLSSCVSSCDSGGWGCWCCSCSVAKCSSSVRCAQCTYETQWYM